MQLSGKRILATCATPKQTSRCSLVVKQPCIVDSGQESDSSHRIFVYKNNSEFMIVGPNSFVDGVEEMLSELKINEDNIKTEKFTGY